VLYMYRYRRVGLGGVGTDVPAVWAAGQNGGEQDTGMRIKPTRRATIVSTTVNLL